MVATKSIVSLLWNNSNIFYVYLSMNNYVLVAYALV